MNESWKTEKAVGITGSNSTSMPPSYGSKNYWESRYRQFYFKCQKVKPPSSLSIEESSLETAVGNSNGAVQRDDIWKNTADSNVFETHLRVMEGDDDPLPRHEWYFSYEELRPLLLQELVNKLFDLIPHLREDEGGLSLLEIGCGDVPIAPNLADDIYIQTGCSAKAIASDYSATVIEYLKEQQRQMQGSSSRNGLQQSTEAKIGTGNHVRQTKDITTAPFDQKLTKSRPRKRHKADDMRQDVLVQYSVEDATDLSYEDNQFHIVLEKGMLDASLSDNENGISRCNSMVGEAARVLRMNGAIVIVSHINAHTSHGQTWVEEVVLPGLFQTCSDCAWSIDVHGNSASDEDDEDISKSNSDSEDDDENVTEKVDEDVNNPQEEEKSLGPAVYILWKKPLSKDSKIPSTTIVVEVSSTDDKYVDFLNQIEMQFFSYEE
jgi:ubiquinone/menaquinone biosynthesis C-methylase UbiE